MTSTLEELDFIQDFPKFVLDRLGELDLIFKVKEEEHVLNFEENIFKRSILVTNKLKAEETRVVFTYLEYSKKKAEEVEETANEFGPVGPVIKKMKISLKAPWDQSLFDKVCTYQLFREGSPITKESEELRESDGGASNQQQAYEQDGHEEKKIAYEKRILPVLLYDASVLKVKCNICGGIR